MKGTQEAWTTAVFNMLTETMNVFPLRVGGIAVTYDDDNIYVDAYVMVSSSSGRSLIQLLFFMLLLSSTMP